MLCNGELSVLVNGEVEVANQQASHVGVDPINFVGLPTKLWRHVNGRYRFWALEIEGTTGKGPTCLPMEPKDRTCLHTVINNIDIQHTAGAGFAWHAAIVFHKTAI